MWLYVRYMQRHTVNVDILPGVHKQSGEVECNSGWQIVLGNWVYTDGIWIYVPWVKVD